MVSFRDLYLLSRTGCETTFARQLPPTMCELRRPCVRQMRLAAPTRLSSLDLYLPDPRLETIFSTSTRHALALLACHQKRAMLCRRCLPEPARRDLLSLVHKLSLPPSQHVCPGHPWHPPACDRTSKCDLPPQTPSIPSKQVD